MPGISSSERTRTNLSQHTLILTRMSSSLFRFLTAQMDIVLGCFPKTCLTHHSFPTTCSKSPCTLCASKSLELLDPKPPSPTVPIHNMNGVSYPTSTWLYWNIHPLHNYIFIFMLFLCRCSIVSTPTITNVGRGNYRNQAQAWQLTSYASVLGTPFSILFPGYWVEVHDGT